MTLYRQLAISIIILFAVGFLGTTITSTSNLRSFIESQLETHAQDTATSLGLSLSPHMSQRDMPVINLMIDAIFDRGYFQSIRLVDIDGNTLVERTRDSIKEPVPAWFIRLVTLRTPAVEATVMSGWKQAGLIHVMSHPGFAYRELWANTRDIFILFLAVTAMTLSAALLTLRFLLRPLHEVEKQAEAICERSWILQSKLPKTRELRSVVVAMNKLTTRVRDLFSEQAEVTEELRRQIYLDPLTGLANRQAFTRQCHILNETGEDVSHGALFLVKLEILKDVNDSTGYQEGDKLIQSTAGFIRKLHNNHVTGFVARISGSEFGLIMDTVDTHDAESIAVNLCEDLKKLREEFTRDARNFAHIGFTMWKHGSKPAELLAEADHALRTASSGEAIDWNRYQADTQAESSIRGKEYARSRALEAVKTGNIRLCTQPVHPNGNAANPVQNEITVRLPDGHGGYTAEGVYHPLIDSMDCAGKLDRLVIEKFLAYMKQDNSQVPCTINLSTTSVTNPDFGSWLLGTLDTSGVKASRIQLEMMENTVVNHIDQARELINRLADAGYRSGIDHFGKDFHPFGYLSTLRISYIKIDGYYTRSINSNRDNQFFVKALKDTVHTLGIDVIAQSIETTAEHETLRSIKLDGYQGYVFGKPDPI